MNEELVPIYSYYNYNSDSDLEDVLSSFSESSEDGNFPPFSGVRFVDMSSLIGGIASQPTVDISHNVTNDDTLPDVPVKYNEDILNSSFSESSEDGNFPPFSGDRFVDMSSLTGGRILREEGKMKEASSNIRSRTLEVSPRYKRQRSSPSHGTTTSPCSRESCKKKRDLSFPNICCGWCNKVNYCNSTCQRMDWAIHKTKCTLPNEYQPKEDAWKKIANIKSNYILKIVTPLKDQLDELNIFTLEYGSGQQTARFYWWNVVPAWSKYTNGLVHCRTVYLVVRKGFHLSENLTMENIGDRAVVEQGKPCSNKFITVIPLQISGFDLLEKEGRMNISGTMKIIQEGKELVCEFSRNFLVKTASSWEDIPHDSAGRPLYKSKREKPTIKELLESVK